MELPHDKIVDDSELLFEKYNIWRDELIARASQLAQAEMEKQREPNREVILQNGQKVSVHALVEMRKIGVREAKQFVQVLQVMLDAQAKDTLEEAWSDEKLTPVPNLTMPDVIGKQLTHF
jgi:hypothetical protein